MNELNNLISTVFGDLDSGVAAINAAREVFSAATKAAEEDGFDGHLKEVTVLESFSLAVAAAEKHCGTHMAGIAAAVVCPYPYTYPVKNNKEVAVLRSGNVGRFYTDYEGGYFIATPGASDLRAILLK
jgi:hypothetical protein